MNRRKLYYGTKKMQKAVFFDRDGTINSDEGHYYIYKPEDFVLNPGVAEGMKKLQDAGYLLFVITNQGGVAKGLYTKLDVENVHQYMQNLLQEKGVTLTKIYYCPHHESVKTCVCRKPSPYMVNLAVDEFNLDKQHCVFIGDSSRDVKCAEAAGIRCIKIQKNQNLLPTIEEFLRNERMCSKTSIVVDEDF